MCIRDRGSHDGAVVSRAHLEGEIERGQFEVTGEITVAEVVDDGSAHHGALEHVYSCLLYTSDAADERSSVDLGGRRIIKKKKNRYKVR